MAEKKQQEFVVSDRRRFAPEGELRTDAPVVEEERPATPPTAPPAAPAPPPAAVQPAQEATPEAESAEMPPPPTAEEQKEQNDAYKASARKLDEMISQTPAIKQRAQAEMTFERLIESFYMTALIQLGAVRQENEPQGVDIIGARQTIDSLTLLQEKTKGNLTEREQHLLQNVLFELRMAWIEITNAIASGAVNSGMPPPPGGIKK
ncbi:MAG TPA: DUF1844 domain-containing protein [Candidatus Angelobacter sp.]